MAGYKLVEEQAFTTPGLTNSIEQIQYYRDIDSTLFVLACDGYNISLYAPEEDSLVFNQPFELLGDTDLYNYRILYGDVNGDSVEDIVVGCYLLHAFGPFPQGEYDSVFRDCRIYLLDGANSFSLSDSAVFQLKEQSDIYGLNGDLRYHKGLTGLQRIDIDGDGLYEFMFSFDHLAMPLYPFSERIENIGNTYTYSSFPNTVKQSNLKRIVYDLSPLNLTETETYFLTTRYSGVIGYPPSSDPTGYNNLSYISLVDSTFKEKASINIQSYFNEWCQYPNHLEVNSYSFSVWTFTHGNIVQVDNIQEIISASGQFFYQLCSDDMFTYFDSSAHHLRMHRVVNATTLEQVWQLNIDSLTIRGLAFDSVFSGQFLALTDTSVLMMKAEDGSIVESIVIPVLGRYFWIYLDGDSDRPRLSVVSGHDVKLYHLDIATDANDPYSGALPDDFILKQNYPNPFNPTTTIELSLPRNGHLKVEVFNLLGQRVTTLIDETKHAGVVQLTWEGNHIQGNTLSSGIYLFKAEYLDQTRTIKALLLK